MKRRFLRTFDLGPFAWSLVVLALLVLLVLGAWLFAALGLNPLGGALMVPAGALLALSAVDRARWGGRRSQHLVTFGDRPASEAEVRRVCEDLGRRGVAAEVERDAEGRPVLGYLNADQRTVVSALLAAGASTPRSGW